MKRNIILVLAFISTILFSQSIDEPFSQKKMRTDFEVFKEIRSKTNSGLYKYRTKQQIDSIYNWASKQIDQSKTYRDFYNIICQLTDFEGSLHNNTEFPPSVFKSIKEETSGYFPYPIKLINGKWRMNFENAEIPVGSEIISINGSNINDVVKNLYKYYTTDGFNTTGKAIGINKKFPLYYRLNYGAEKDFKVEYKEPDSDLLQSKLIKSISYPEYYKNFANRYSKPFDKTYYSSSQSDEKYSFKKLNAETGILTIYTFAMGDENSVEHKNYADFLERTFKEIKEQNLKNLIVDVRFNGGGTEPNDILTYSYLTNRKFQENKEAWINFAKVPLLKYYNINIPRFLRPLVVGKYNKELQNIFQLEKYGKYYETEKSNDHKIWEPASNAFNGNIYLLISPAIASAGSLFASMVAGNPNTIIIGEESMGGYYGHNGHTPVEYKLPNSKIITVFSIVNLEQDVPKKESQKVGRGIMPDYTISQSFEDFLKNQDTQLNYTINLIDKK